MKKVFKFISHLALAVVTIYSLYRIYVLIKKYDVIPMVQGFDEIKRQNKSLADISGRGVKFIAPKNDIGLETFSHYLSEKGYRLVGQFGRSDLYSYQGFEVVVRKTTLFNNYYLFEIYNESFFENDLAS